MGKLFNPDSPVMQALNKIADLVLLNVLCLILCIPIFTIGAAVTALYDAAGRMMREEGGIYRAFFSAFRSNFKQATGMWLILLVVGGLLALCVMFYANSQLQIMLYLTVILAFLWCAVVAWVFPLQARFYNAVKDTLRNAALCAIAYLPRTIVMVVLNIFPFALALLHPIFFFRSSVLYILVWFAMAASINLQVIRKPLQKMIEQVDPDAAAAMDPTPRRRQNDTEED